MTIVNMVGGGGDGDVDVNGALISYPLEYANTLARMRMGDSTSGYASIGAQPMTKNTCVSIYGSPSNSAVEFRAYARVDKQRVTIWEATITWDWGDVYLVSISKVVASNNKFLAGLWIEEENVVNGGIAIVNNDGSGVQFLPLTSLPLSNVIVYGICPLSDTDAVIIFSSDAELYYAQATISDSLTVGSAVKMNITTAARFAINAESESNGYVYLSLYNSASTHASYYQTDFIYFTKSGSGLRWGNITQLSSANCLRLYTGFDRTYVGYGDQQAHLYGFIKLLDGSSVVDICNEGDNEYEHKYLMMSDGSVVQISQVGAASRADVYLYNGIETYQLNTTYAAKPTSSGANFVLEDGVSANGSYNLVSVYSTSDKTNYGGVVINNTVYIWN